MKGVAAAGDEAGDSGSAAREGQPLMERFDELWPRLAVARVPGSRTDLYGVIPYAVPPGLATPPSRPGPTSGPLF